jgi:hypothetical protein
LADATRTVTDYPTSVTNSNAPKASATVFYQKVAELASDNGALLKTWDLLDMVDPRRVSYLVGRITKGWDALHANAVIEDPKDDSIIVSLRHQNAVIKFSRGTGQIRWILGPHEGWAPDWQPYLLTPVGEPFEWQYGQHAPRFTPQGTLMLYDNGNFRAMPFAPRVADTNNYSRAVEYQIDEQTMEVRQVWEYGRTNVADRFFTPYEGSAEALPRTGNVLIGFPAITYVNGVHPSLSKPTATMARIQEVTHEAAAEIVFDLAITMFDKPAPFYPDCSVYRAVRIPDLYGHPTNAIVDLALSRDEEGVTLQFTGDPTRTHTVEGSINLQTWTDIGQATEDDERAGTFVFQDRFTQGTSWRYYRVRTE